jgi:PPK2 family polyphosphate:nucleotide phosphotransferase
MQIEQAIDSCRKLCAPYRVNHGEKFDLSRVDPGDAGEFKSTDKKKAKKALQANVDLLCEFQERLYAQDQWAVLLIFQALDTAGKDGVIKHVMSGVNPQGCEVHSFKAPTSEELDHDYLWRCTRRLPERGRIGIFNRSYYEEVLVVRTHPEILRQEKIPPSLITKKIWEDRFEDIRNFELYLGRNGIVIRKFFLHVSKEEQRKRFLERIEQPQKRWKFSDGDVREARFWRENQRAYEEMVQQTATPEAPWFVVPADHKWFTRLIVGAAVSETLASLNLQYPKLSPEQEKEMKAARAELLGKGAQS